MRGRKGAQSELCAVLGIWCWTARLATENDDGVFWGLQVTTSAEVDQASEQEIFEFPWVVFDVSSKQVVDEKTVYIKPTLHEKLGEQCAKAVLGEDAAKAMNSAGTLQQAVQVIAYRVVLGFDVVGIAVRVFLVTSIYAQRLAVIV